MIFMNEDMSLREYTNYLKFSVQKNLTISFTIFMTMPKTTINKNDSIIFC